MCSFILIIEFAQLTTAEVLNQRCRGCECCHLKRIVCKPSSGKQKRNFSEKCWPVAKQEEMDI
jgi:hypothetical protein